MYFIHKNVRVFSWISINISDRCDIEVFFILNHPFRGVHFAVNRFTYGQSWLTKGTWFWISSLLLNHFYVMVNLLVKSTYFIRPKSLSNLCRLFRRTRWYLRMKRSQDPIWIPTDSSILASSEFENPKWRCTCDSHVYWLKSCLFRILESRYDPFVRGCLQIADTSSKAQNEYWCPYAKLVIEKLLVRPKPMTLCCLLYFSFVQYRIRHALQKKQKKIKFTNIVCYSSG